MHEVLVDRLGGLSLPGRGVVGLADRPGVALGVCRGRGAAVQQCGATTNQPATCPSIPAARFAFRLCFIHFVFLVRSCCIR